MSGYDDIAAALIGDMDPDTAIQRETLRYAVQRQMFDGKTGAVLDVSTAVLITLTTPDQKRVLEVFDGARYDKIAALVAARCRELDITLEIADGRVLFGGQPASDAQSDTDATCRCPDTPKHRGPHRPGCPQRTTTE